MKIPFLNKLQAIISKSSSDNGNMPFSERVEKFWQWFENNCDNIESLMHQERFDRIPQLMSKGIDIIGEDIYYNVGNNNELNFCVDGNTTNFFIYPYIVARMPESLRSRWTVNPCKQPCGKADFGLDIYGKRIIASEVMVSVSYISESDFFDVRYYHPALAELDKSLSLNAFYILAEMIAGEGAVFNYFNDVTQASAPNGMFSIEELPDALRFYVEENGKEYSSSPKMKYTAYQCNPRHNEQRLRYDIIQGYSRFMPLTAEYSESNHPIFNRFVAKGVSPAMLIISRPEGLDNKEFLDFRFRIEDKLNAMFEAYDNVSGLTFGASLSPERVYFDLLLFNNQQFLDYIRRKEVLDKLLIDDTGSVYQVNVSFKLYRHDAPVIELQ